MLNGKITMYFMFPKTIKTLLGKGQAIKLT